MKKILIAQKAFDKGISPLMTRPDNSDRLQPKDNPNKRKASAVPQLGWFWLYNGEVLVNTLVPETEGVEGEHSAELFPNTREMAEWQELKNSAQLPLELIDNPSLANGGIVFKKANFYVIEVDRTPLSEDEQTALTAKFSLAGKKVNITAK